MLIIEGERKERERGREKEKRKGEREREETDCVCRQRLQVTTKGLKRPQSSKALLEAESWYTHKESHSRY